MKTGDLALHTPAVGIVQECEIIEDIRPRYLLGRWWYDLYLIHRADGEIMTCCAKYLVPIGSKYAESEKLTATEE